MSEKTVDQPLIFLAGPTAVGKTELSLRLAEQFGCEIISVDSMQVYRFMDIGTAKASLAERARVPHHLIDIVDPDEDYDAGHFVADAISAIANIHSRKKIPLLTGGTGLYFKSLLQGVFQAPEIPQDLRQGLRQRLLIEGVDVLHKELSVIDCDSAKRLHKHDCQRVLRALEVYHATGRPWSDYLREHQSQGPQVKFDNVLQLCLVTERSELYRRIDVRCQLMIQAGLEGEVKNLAQMGYDYSLKPFGAIGYKHLCGRLSGFYESDSAMMSEMQRDTRRYAKRQMTWFRAMDKMTFCDVCADKDKIYAEISRFLESIAQRAGS